MSKKIYLNPDAIKENTIPIDKIVTVDLAGKQDVISDLDNIRNGAAKGATALQSVPEIYVTKDDLKEKVDKVSGKGLSTNDFTNELKQKLDGLNENANVLMTNITWQELKDLRDSNNLIPGMQYRIIDYVTTTDQERTISAGHQFDIIVTADDEKTLNEEARACIHKEKFGDISKYNICYMEGLLEQPLNFVQDYTYNDKTYRLYRGSEFEVLIDFYNLIEPEDYITNTFNFAVLSNYVKYPENSDWISWPEDGHTLEFEFDPYLIYPYQKAYNLLDECNVNYIEDYEYLGKTYRLYEDENGMQFLVDFTRQHNTVDINIDYKYGIFPDFIKSSSDEDWYIGLDQAIIAFKSNPNISELYFSKNKLESWKISYSLDNDMTRFAWAVDYLSPDTKNKMIMVNDVWHNPAEGRNLVFVRNSDYDENGKCAWLVDDGWIGDSEDERTFRFYVRNSESLNNNAIIYTDNEDVNIGDILMDSEEACWRVISPSIGKGVIYRMIDEFGNDCPYDFKNIRYLHRIGTSTDGFAIFNDSGISKYIYTFSGSSCNMHHDYWSGVDYISDLLDGSLIAPYSFVSDSEYDAHSFTNNIIKPYIRWVDPFALDVIDQKNYASRMVLNNIVMLGFWQEIGTHIDDEFEYFSSGCSNNIFGYNCWGNTGERCCNNTFESSCYLNNLVDMCTNNHFKSDCCENYLNGCSNTIFGINCRTNFVGWRSNGNSFGNNCCNNHLGGYCHDNSFGNDCYGNSFGNDCYSNSFGNDCCWNSLGYNCCWNSFGNACYYNSFKSSISAPASLKDYCSYNHFDDGCSYNVIYSSETTGSSNKLQNININRGVCGANLNSNFINIDIIKADYEIQVAKNSKGDIKIYCEADLIP